MSEHVILVFVPGLRGKDLESMPRLAGLVSGGDRAELGPGCPAVTSPVQANMLTGVSAEEHGVVANGFFWREKNEVEMWTSPNDCILRPQLWDILHKHDPSLTIASWFMRHTKHCGADYVCTEAPIHNPDGSESLWCYTRPEPLYGGLRDALGHFPLQHFWGPIANIKSTEWIVASAVEAAGRFMPNLFVLYLPHLDYAAQKNGPDSEEAGRSLAELDAEFGKLIDGMQAAYGDADPMWMVVSEYVITPVERVSYPNRLLREAGFLKVRDSEHGAVIDFAESRAWALVDHQVSHVYLRDPADATAVKSVIYSDPSIDEVLGGEDLAKYDLRHERSGELVAISHPDAWQAYYYWLEDSEAPGFARTVDIHRKPGYDPVELFFDPATKSIPLDATLVRGSHGAPAVDSSQRGVLLCNQRGVFVEGPTADTDVADIVLRQFGI